MRGGTYYHAPSSTTPPIAPHQLPAKCLATEAESNSRPARSEGTTTGIRSGKRGMAPHYLDAEIPFLEPEKRSRATSQTTPKEPSDATEFLYSNFGPLNSRSECGKIPNEDGSRMDSLSREDNVAAAKAMKTSSSTTPPPVPKKRKGDTDMLTPENPYGKNPPLPADVLEAMNHLKLLSDPKTAPSYTA